MIPRSSSSIDYTSAVNHGLTKLSVVPLKVTDSAMILKNEEHYLKPSGRHLILPPQRGTVNLSQLYSGGLTSQGIDSVQHLKVALNQPSQQQTTLQRESPYKSLGGGANNLMQSKLQGNKNIEAQAAYNQNELSMRKTNFNGSGNAHTLMYRQKHKKDQVLISINCSKASPGLKSKMEENHQIFSQNTKSTSGGVYGIDQGDFTASKISSKTPHISKHDKQSSMYHLSCRDGSSMMERASNNVSLMMPSIQNGHKKHSSLFNYLGESSKASVYEPLIRAQQRVSSLASNSQTQNLIAKQSIQIQRQNMMGGDAAAANKLFAQNGVKLTSLTNQARKSQSPSIHNDSQLNLKPLYVSMNNISSDFDIGQAHKQSKTTNEKSFPQHYQNMSQANKLHSYHEHFASPEIDLEELFPLAEAKKLPAVMYKRAMKQLKTILQSKGIKDTGQSMEKSDYGLLHFHIEASDNDIKMNKFDTNKNANQGGKKGGPIIFHESIDENSIEFNPEDVYTSDFTIPSHINKEIQGDHVHEVHIENFESVEVEDLIDDKLVRDSPIIEKKRKPVEKFMMKLKVTMQNDDAVSQASFATANEFAKHLKSSHTSKNKTQRTILFTRENNDLDPDYLNLELKQFVKLDEENLAKAYTRLIKITQPVFSGSVNTLINKIDDRKVAQDGEKDVEIKKKVKIEKKRKSDLNAIESDLLEELRLCKEALESKKMIYGLWSVNNQQGSIPHSREGSVACMIDHSFYLFGGFSRDLFGDFRIYDTNNCHWKLMPQQMYTPSPRYSHTMITYDKKLVVFGGAGGYLTAIKMRMGFNDVSIFDTETEIWQKQPEIEGAPSKRTNHTAAILGGFMIVHGGYNTEQKKTLHDFGLFDLEKQKWILHKVYTHNENDNKYYRIDDKHFPYDKGTDESMIGFRQMHSINAIFDQDHYDDLYRGNRLKARRGMWIRERRFTHEEMVKGLNFQEGLYMFGGIDHQGHTHNDLWLIQPHIEENELVLIQSSFEFLQQNKQSLSIRMKRVQNFSGRPPCPRIFHGTTVFKDWNKHYFLVIYGGRNDQIFARTQNVALNDICMFNVNTSQWIALAMFGDAPVSRWSHCFVPNRGHHSGSADGFFIFGGVNLKNYCKSRIYQFQILNKWYTSTVNTKAGKQIKDQLVEEEGFDEKIATLASYVRQKTDIVKEILRGKDSKDL